MIARLTVPLLPCTVKRRKFIVVPYSQHGYALRLEVFQRASNIEDTLDTRTDNSHWGAACDEREGLSDYEEKET